MSYDSFDAAQDDLYEEIARELYSEHKTKAISEFTLERLQSFYAANPRVMRPAVDAIQEGRKLQANGHHAAALVFFVSAIELLLKATLLKPVVHGLVHSEGLAEVIVQQALGQPGFDRYSKLLTKLFMEIAGFDINSIFRSGGSVSLLNECNAQQAHRNKIIHQGAGASVEEAEVARTVAVAVYDEIVREMLGSLRLKVVEHGEIIPGEA